MAKSLAASQKLMKNYLSELLTEELPTELKAQEVASLKVYEDKVVEKEPLEKLLAEVPETDIEVSKPLSRRNPLNEKIQEIIPEAHSTLDSFPLAENDEILNAQQVKKTKNYREGSFQAMFFDVAGLVVAVPLIELGGIHNLDHVNSLMGKPDWFKGVMLHKQEKINVVDTALWVMPEKYDQNLKDSLNYRYIIMLGSSSWGLSAEKLIDTVTLNQDDIKWLDSPTKRPWLAGLVKDRMCALLEVDALINLLNDGVNVNKK